MFRRLVPVLAAAALALALGAGCGKDDPAAPGLPDGAVPDVHLVDVNPTSTSFDQPVSPRDRLHQVSAWYFGHAT
ncbi:MAG TPA: hypothetical protein PLQ13_05530 [Candidatus Krumholzibacteria bacterium]|nr:hypothetical protein [Candidatus Krumholzibacteria bacterium]